jgi:diguanylate cyclase (GGDEF)-like protein
MDGLKKINDTYGHVEGDSALIIMANAISSACTSHEYPARVGGDEFYIIGTDEYTPDDIEHKKNKIKRYLDEYNSTSEKNYEVENSTGILCIKPDGMYTMTELLDKADKLMYADKIMRKKERKN